MPGPFDSAKVNVPIMALWHYCCDHIRYYIAIIVCSDAPRVYIQSVSQTSDMFTYNSDSKADHPVHNTTYVWVALW